MVDSLPEASRLSISPAASSWSRPNSSDEQFPVWLRSLVGLAYLSAGAAAATVGLASISYRMTNMTVKDGLVNGRAVRIQAPIDGKIQNFYARPGARVQAGQVLAQLAPIAHQDSANSLRERTLGSVADASLSAQATEVQFVSAQKTLALLNRQLQELVQQEQVQQNTVLSVASQTIEHSTAVLAAATSQETAARNKYERFKSLLQKGAVSQQEVDELEADWRSSQAAVRQAESEQTIARINADAISQQIPMESGLRGLQAQKRQLAEEIQYQTNRLDLLALELELQSPEGLEAAELSTAGDTVSSGLSDASLMPLMAPFEGVVYDTHHDVGEQVNRPTALLSLLDCSALWVEALVTTDQAMRVDVGQPVRIRHGSSTETVIGQVDFVTAISAGEITKARSEALIPAVSANLVGQPLARIRVSLPATQMQGKDYRFCGVGESAQLTFGTEGNRITEFFSKLPRF